MIVDNDNNYMPFYFYCTYASASYSVMPSFGLLGLPLGLKHEKPVPVMGAIL